MSSKRFGILLYLLVGLLLVGCGYDSHEAVEPRFEMVVSTLHLSQLSSYEESGARLPEGAIIRGRVVADDSSGNFYRAVVLEGEDVGVELRLALYNLSALYPSGSEVVVRCGGLRVVRTDGVLTIGREVYGWSGGALEPIAPRSEVLSRVEVVAKCEPTQEPLRVTIAELGESLCGRLVEIEGLRYEGKEETWGSVEYVGNSDRVMADSEGSSVKVRTHSNADFASVVIPEGELRVRGILYKTGEKYVIKPRVRSDVEQSE